MLNKLERFVRQNRLLFPNDRAICAVSGGADSVALLMALYLLRDKLKITLEAAHFNHCLRGEESDEDERFVAELCERLGIPLHRGRGSVTTGKKGLEAAARDARYDFLLGLGGIVATAHTANDNAETVLMHLLRGTGLKGLGAIAPRRGHIIRPMLSVTRDEVITFLEEYHLEYRTDSSNLGDQFLRNRIRHQVIPLLEQENPRFAENVSAMALRLREDEKALQSISQAEYPLQVETLRKMPKAVRYRILCRFLEESGVKEPEAEHVSLVDALLFSQCPSAKACLPGGVIVCRQYELLVCQNESIAPQPRELTCPGTVDFGDYIISCLPAEQLSNTPTMFSVAVRGTITVRSRSSGDVIRMAGGSKTLKKLFIDLKIPASYRMLTPVLSDDDGVVGVCGIGADLDHLAKDLPAWQICIHKKKN